MPTTQPSQTVTLSRRFSPDATVSGGNILSMLAAMGPFRRRGEQILEENGIREVQADGWYPLQAYVTALRAIGSKMGPNTLFQIGRQIPNHVPLPPGIDNFEKVLASFGMAFDMNHRGAEPGAITFDVKNPRNATITTGTPYPCDFDRGVIVGFFQKLLSTRVAVDPMEGAPCKARGGETCTYGVTLPLM
jgi:predicted hydrocarbon binding protein